MSGFRKQEVFTDGQSVAEAGFHDHRELERRGAVRLEHIIVVPCEGNLSGYDFLVDMEAWTDSFPEGMTHGEKHATVRLFGSVLITAKSSPGKLGLDTDGNPTEETDRQVGEIKANILAMLQGGKIPGRNL